MPLLFWLAVAGATFTLPGAERIPVYWDDFEGSPGTAAIYCNLPVFGEGTHSFLCDGFPDGSIIINGPLFDAVVDEQVAPLRGRFSASTVAMVERIVVQRLLLTYLCHEYAHHVLGPAEGETEWERHQEEKAYAFGYSCPSQRPAWSVLGMATP